MDTSGINRTAGFARQPEGVRRRGAAWVIAGAALLVLGPLVYKEAPRERARFFQAWAEEQRLAGQPEAAIAALNQAIQVGGEEPEFLLGRAELQCGLGRFAECERDLERAVEVAADEQRVAVHAARSEIHLKMRRWDAALDDWKRIAALSEQWPGALRPAVILNSLAYMRALAKTELEQALEDIELAIRQAGDNAAFLDTRGYVHYQLGNYRKALSDLTRAVELARTERETMLEVQTAEEKLLIDLRPLREQRHELARNFAVILYHRGLANDLFDAEAAGKDFAEVRQLGFEPGDELY